MTPEERWKAIRAKAEMFLGADVRDATIEAIRDAERSARAEGATEEAGNIADWIEAHYPFIHVGILKKVRERAHQRHAKSEPKVQWKDMDDPAFKTMTAADEARIREIVREEIRAVEKIREDFRVEAEAARDRMSRELRERFGR